MTKFLISIFCLLLTTSLFAREGRVIRIRGEAYARFLKSKKPVRLYKGHKVKGNALVTTKKKSFVKIKFEDGSIISLGPNAKIALSQNNKKKPRLVELLRGKIRGIVDPKSKGTKGYKHKMYVSTRSASIGIRGTDFLLIYNEKNKITSNITLKGDVHLYKKKDEEIHESLREELDDKKQIKFGQGNELDNIADHLKHHDTKSIPKGHFSGAYPSYEKSSEPVHISMPQLNALGKNKDLGNKSKGRVVRGGYKLAMGGDKNSHLVPEPYGENQSTKSKRKLKSGVRHGGHVDLNTGIYIAPPGNARYDKKTGLYAMPEGLGGIDPETGHYVAPEGVKLDPLKGFVVADRNYGDRNIKENLKRIQNLTGNFNERLDKALKIFKQISRFDVLAIGNYRYSTNVMENYYGEWTNITNTPSMVWDFKGFTGFQLFHNKRYLFYPKASLFALYHERALPEIKRNNTYEGMLGLEFHRKHELFGKKARFIVDLEFRTEYMDWKKRNLFDFYTEDSGIRLSEVFKFNRSHRTEAYYQARAFQGYIDANHGNIHNVGFNHRYMIGPLYDLLAGFEFSQRREKVSNDYFDIWNGYMKAIRKDLFWRTDLTFGYTYQTHESKENIPFDIARFYKLDFQLNKRLNNFWKINALYEYSRQRAKGATLTKSFIQQTWGGGLTMVF
ncbi:MAG: FecR domain-containing protein [Bacteriovoracaceae bacterium]|nr:FecR domain-containing protein [Bacteriovoracaceae bacterium]